MVDQLSRGTGAPHVASRPIGRSSSLSLVDVLLWRNLGHGPGIPLPKRLLWPLLRAYARCEFPGFGHVLNWFGLNDQPRWAGAPTIRVRERLHGHRVEVDLSDFFQRIVYFFGCYNELDVLSTVGLALRSGEAFVDGGANIGLLTLHAASVVGKQGRIDSFECNPEILGRLRRHVRANAPQNVIVHGVGLGDAPAVATMRLPDPGNRGAGTLSPIPERYGGEGELLGEISVVRGDDVLDPRDDRPLTIKLDVEGYEIKALRGLWRTIERRRPAILTEVNPELLERTGGSVDQMREMLESEGYRAWAIDRGGWRSRHRMWLHPLLGVEIAWERDVLWLHECSRHRERLAGCIQGRGMYWRHHLFARLAAEAGRQGTV